MTRVWPRVTVLVAACWVPLACTSDGSGIRSEGTANTAVTSTAAATPTSDPPSSTSTSAAPTTSTSSTTTVSSTSAPPSSAPNDPTVVDIEQIYANATPLVADDAPCEPAWSELTSPSGEVTFTRDGHVFSFDPATGDLRCLATVDRDPSALDWNPAGDRLLVDEDLIVTAEDQHASGFDPGTTGISWSQPAGTALIAPNADGTALRHISATNAADETDVSSLRMTWAAAYHPSGLAIVSAGIDDNGVAGLFIADNLGNGPQTLVFLEDPATTITEVAFAHNGDWVTFVHDHTDGTIDEGVAAHIHRIHLPDLLLEDVIAQVDVVPQQLVASEQVDGSIAWQETHSTVNHQTFAWSGGDVVSLGFPETEVVPVGFVDGGTAVAKVRSDGTPRETAGQLWIYPPGDAPVLIARGVTAAATRTIHHPNWSDPPLQIEQQAVG